MESRFYLGIDAGADGAVSAALVEKRQERDDAAVEYHINRIERMSENGDTVEHFKNLLADEPFVGNSLCIVNASQREGRKLVREMAAEGLSPMALTINGGDDPSADGAGIQTSDGEDSAGFSVSERTIIRNLIDHETEGSFVFDAQHADLASELAAGLQDYRAIENSDESDSSAEALSEDSVRNRDLVLSAALACWVGDQQAIDPTEHLGGELPTTGGAKRMQRPDTSN